MRCNSHFKKFGMVLKRSDALAEILLQFLRERQAAISVSVIAFSQGAKLTALLSYTVVLKTLFPAQAMVASQLDVQTQELLPARCLFSSEKLSYS